MLILSLDASLSLDLYYFSYWGTGEINILVFLQAMDIDEILQRAETQETNDGAHSVGEDLLSQFKVCLNG